MKKIPSSKTFEQKIVSCQVTIVLHGSRKGFSGGNKIIFEFAFGVLKLVFYLFYAEFIPKNSKI